MHNPDDEIAVGELDVTDISALGSWHSQVPTADSLYVVCEMPSFILVAEGNLDLPLVEGVLKVRIPAVVVVITVVLIIRVERPVCVIPLRQEQLNSLHGPPRTDGLPELRHVGKLRIVGR